MNYDRTNSQKIEERSSFRQLLPRYLLCYLLWLICSALSVWTLFELRNAVLSFLPIVGPWVMTALDKFTFLIFGLAILGWIIFVEDFLRNGVSSGRLWPRTRRVAIIQAIALAIAFGVQLLSLFWVSTT